MRNSENMIERMFCVVFFLFFCFTAIFVDRFDISYKRSCCEMRTVF